MPKTKTIRFYAYDACGTCKKARKWLDARGIAYDVVPIVEKPPTASELTAWIAKSQLPARKWFNTSGQSYRALVAELGKEKVAAMTEAEIIERLSRDGETRFKLASGSRDEKRGVMIGIITPLECAL